MKHPSEIKDFYEVAKEYCDWAEKKPNEDSGEALTAMLLLSALYHRALYLPETTPQSPIHDVKSGKYGEAPSKGIYERFKTMPLTQYTELYDPTLLESQEPVIGDIAEDLRDIHADLKDGVLQYEQGLVANAAFIWRSMFGLHWGRHVLSALRALHCHVAKESG